MQVMSHMQRETRSRVDDRDLAYIQRSVEYEIAQLTRSRTAHRQMCHTQPNERHVELREMRRDDVPSEPLASALTTRATSNLVQAMIDGSAQRSLGQAALTSFSDSPLTTAPS